MELPNPELADYLEKIKNYCLNFDHGRGKDKAYLFQKKLGITLENAEILIQAIQKAIITERAVLHKENDFGRYYNLRFFLRTEQGESWILSAWVVRKGENFPRLGSCYPVRK